MFIRGCRPALVALLAAAPVAQAADTPPPTDREARLAIAAFDRGAWRYDGVVTGVPLSGQLILSITEAENGDVQGEALLLAPDRHLLAASAVAGRAEGTTCRLDLTLGGQSERLDGVCSPQLVGGRVVISPPTPDLLTRLVSWWDDRSVEGEAWLEPDTGLVE